MKALKMTSRMKRQKTMKSMQRKAKETRRSNSPLFMRNMPHKHDKEHIEIQSHLFGTFSV